MIIANLPFSKKILIGLSIIVVILALGSSLYFYHQYQKAQMLLKNPAAISNQEVQTLVMQVGKLIELPTNETPTIATITDISKLKNQPFFAQAQNNDKVLIYPKAKKAILYRPSANKVIDVAPVAIGPTPSAAATAAIRVALYNGTKTVGLTSKVEKELKDEIPQIEVTTKDNANKNDYTKSIIIDVSGNYQSQAEQLAKALNGEIGKLPVGETKPDSTDIIIILGGM